MTLSKRRGDEIAGKAKEWRHERGPYLSANEDYWTNEAYCEGATHYATQLEEVERKLERVKTFLKSSCHCNGIVDCKMCEFAAELEGK